MSKNIKIKTEGGLIYDLYLGDGEMLPKSDGPIVGYIGTVESVSFEGPFEVKMVDGPTFELPEPIAWIEPGCRIQVDYLNLTIELLSPPA